MHDRLSPAQAGALLGVTEATLATWRSRGVTRGLPPLPYSKAGRKVFYTRADVDAFAAVYVVKHDSKQGVKV